MKTPLYLRKALATPFPHNTIPVYRCITMQTCGMQGTQIFPLLMAMHARAVVT